MKLADPGLLLLDANGSILWANAAVAELLEFSLSELREMAVPLTDASGAAAVGPIAKGANAICAEGAQEAEGTARFRTKTDAKLSVRWSLWPLPGREGNTQVLLSLWRVDPVQGDEHAQFKHSADIDVALKTAQAALRYSEERFRRLVETTNVVPWEGTIEGDHFTYVGPQAVALLGYPLEDWLKNGFWDDVVHPEDRAWVRVVRAEALEKRENFECEYRMVGASSRVLKVREMVSILSCDDGTPILGGFLLDVTNRWLTEESLKESRHFIEQIAGASPTISYLYDLQKAHCIYANGRIGDILGVSKETLTEMHPFFILALGHPSESPAHASHFEHLHLAAEDTVIGRDFRLRSVSGAWVWVYSRECVFKRDANGAPVQIVGTLEDVTLARHTMDELEANEARFRKLAESARVIPFEFDPRLDRFTYVGPQAEAILGVQMLSGLSRDAWRSLLHPNDIFEGMRFARADSRAPAADFETEFRIRARGKQLWVRQIVHRGAGDDGERVTGFLFDMTEAKRIQDEHEEARTMVRELTARSHQFREEERRSIARELHDELGQALTLLKLDLSWLDGRIRKMNSPFDLEASRVASPVSAECANKVQEMEERLDGTLNMLRRVLSALRPPLLDELGLSDAIEYHAMEFAQRTGLRCNLQIEKSVDLPIDISLALFRIFQEVTTNIAKHAHATSVSISLELRARSLVLKVTDDGVGMGPLTRGEKSRHYGLLGIRERAWAFGGQIAIESSPGNGTKVCVEVPNSAPNVGVR